MKRKIIGSIFAGLLLTAAVALMFFNYKTNHARTEIERVSENGYELIILEIGEPDFPFGATHCAFKLTKDGRKITFYRFDVADDGARAQPELFETRWFADRVEITVTASEQEVIHYQLFFNGGVNSY